MAVVGSVLTKEQAMRMQHLLLLSTIVVSSEVLAAESKQAAQDSGKPDGISRSEPARNTALSDELTQLRPARKNRVHYSFPPSTKRM